MKNAIPHIGRIAEILVGITFLAAAVLKAQDINLFIGQILAYQIFVTPSALTVVAFCTLALETFIGLSMVLGSPWRKAVLVLCAAMLLFFTGLIAYAWQVHGLKDCGCFGKVPFTPPRAIAKNIMLLFLNGIAWYGLIYRDAPAASARKVLRFALPALAATLLCGFAAPQLGGSGTKGGTPAGEATAPSLAGETAPGAALPDAVFKNYQITTEYGEDLDLGQGEYLIALLSMTCEHCMASVPQINAYMAESALPRVVALCLEPEEGSMLEFQSIAAPEFPMHSVGNDMLEWARICEGAPPRLCYVRSGAVLASWNLDLPDYQTLIASIEQARADNNV